MFTTGITWLTSFAMLWHGIAGCCWHHAHAEGATETPCACAPVAEPVVAAPVAVASCCAGHTRAKCRAADATPSARGEAGASVADRCCQCGDRHGAGCSESECSFLKHRSVELPDLLSVADAGPVDVAAALPEPSGLLGADQSADRHPPPAAAVRRALTQVWLL